MPRHALLCVLLLAAATIASAAPVSFRVIFGDHADRPVDYSGTIRLSGGRVTSIDPWRFLDGDSVNGTTGWTLNLKNLRFENQPDKPRPMMTGPQVMNIVPAGLTITVEAPGTATASITTEQGNFDIALADLRYDRELRYLDGDVIVQRTPTVGRVSPPSKQDPAEHFDYPSITTAGGSTWIAWQGYHDEGDHLFVSHSTGSGWSEPERITSQKADIYRTALATDAQGRVWFIWSERDGRDWDLYARSHAGGNWSSSTKITSGSTPNIFHRLTADREGNLHLIWVAHESGQSYVHWSRLNGDKWSKPQPVSGPSAWNPEAATDSAGNLWIVWDSYRTGNYDIFLRKITAAGELGDELQVTKSSLFQTHATIAVDKKDRIWLAWHESGPNWGKDWTHEDDRRATVLYTNRSPKIAVLDAGEWKQPATDLISAVPQRYHRYVQYPRILADAEGRIWCGLQMRTSSANQRDDWWAFDGRWEHFLTTLEGNRWTPPMPLADSSLRPEGPLLLHAAAEGLQMAWTNDNRPLTAPSFYGWIPTHNEIMAASFSADAAAAPPTFEPFTERNVNIAAVHPDEAGDVARLRDYRLNLNGQPLRILRGDFHRHTEISSDGSGDGSLEDYFRYMIDAAAMDTGIVGDHNIGNDDEYAWWRTEKASDLFHIPGRYTPMFGYERSPSYPNGHRNLVFSQRGVKTLPVSRAEMRGQARTGPILYPHLKENNGIAMSHSSATSQGTDWGDNDPEVEPLVELYQGYHASYEYPGAPRAESDNLQVSVHGRYRPEGFWWEALKKGFKIGVQGSSDHISTHASYTLVYSPSAERNDILESMRSRHAYAATDNIIIDYTATTAEGVTHMMGDAIKAASAPDLKFKIIGTDDIIKVDLIKDQTFVYHSEPNAKTVEFTFRDTEPSKRESYYYVRIQQRDRNLAWSSPIWVDYR
jgi:uncharacterized protein DUF3604